MRLDGDHCRRSSPALAEAEEGEVTTDEKEKKKNHQKPEGKQPPFHGGNGIPKTGPLK
jgi:hypothetical protein